MRTMPEEKTTPEVKTEVSSPEAHSPSAKLRDKRILPEGVVPKQAQAYVVAGLALLILLAVLFSKNHARSAPKQAATAPTAVSNNANRQRIQELEENLSADQRQGERQQAQSVPKTGAASPSGFTSATNAARPMGNATAVEPQSPVPPPRDPIAEAEKALAFKARFASNLVTPASVATAALPATSSAAVNNSLSLQPNIAAANARSAAQQDTAPQAAAAGNRHAPEVSIDAAHGRPYVVFAGTMIDTVLTNRLDSDFAGPVKAMVTNPIYSRDGQHVLIPAGTFILGDTRKVGSMGQTRLTMTFHRMIMPDGYSVDLDQFHGLDQIGDTGLKGKVNRHYLRIFGASIALGLVAGAAEATTSGGYITSGSDMYRQGVASSLSQSSGDVLDRFINIAPTITIREGHRIKIYLTQDMLLPAYSDHDMPGVM